MPNQKQDVSNQTVAVLLVLTILVTIVGGTLYRLHNNSANSLNFVDVNAGNRDCPLPVMATLASERPRQRRS